MSPLAFPLYPNIQPATAIPKTKAKIVATNAVLSEIHKGDKSNSMPAALNSN
jgi:hypothetical protein